VLEPFSREAFIREFESIDAEHTALDDRGDTDLTSWIQRRAQSLLGMLQTSQEHYMLMRRAIEIASPGEVLKIARQVIEETA